MSNKRLSVETLSYDYTALDRVCCGSSYCEGLLEQVLDLGAHRVFVIASGTLSQKTAQFESLSVALGERFAGLFDEIGSHTPRSDVMRALAAVRQANADLLVAIGGGSIIDATKAVQLALDQGVESPEQLMEYAQFGDGTRGSKHGDFSLFGGGSSIRQIAVPTTLSGAEFSNNAGVTNTDIGAKEGYKGIDLCPQTVLYDPQLSTHTPQWLWLSTAIRSLDHAIEGFCSEDCHHFVAASFLHAMSLFAQSLPRVKANPDDLQARSENQQAVWLACNGLGKVSHGASHGIGYILGSFCAVPHGYTSCVMLPAVLEWNQPVNGERQAAIAEALGKPSQSASQAVKDLIADLRLPTRLRDVGVQENQLAEIAARAYQHPVVRRNPRKILDAAAIREVLDLAW